MSNASLFEYLPPEQIGDSGITREATLSGSFNIELDEWNKHARVIWLSTMANSQNEINDKITINKGISLQEWKESLDYSNEQIKNIMEKILYDFDIEVNDNSLTWLNNVIYSTIDMYEKQYNTKLEETTKKMLRNLITKMSYDRLCVKDLI